MNDRFRIETDWRYCFDDFDKEIVKITREAFKLNAWRNYSTSLSGLFLNAIQGEKRNVWKVIENIFKLKICILRVKVKK